MTLKVWVGIFLVTESNLHGGGIDIHGNTIINRVSWKLRPQTPKTQTPQKKRKKKKICLKCYHLNCSSMVTQCSYATAIGQDIYLVWLIASASIKECKTNKVQNSSRHCFSNQFSDLFSDPKTQTSWDLKKRLNSYQFSLPWWSFMNNDHKQQPESRDFYLRWVHRMTESTASPSQIRVQVSGQHFFNNTKMSFFDFAIYLWTAWIIILLFLLKAKVQWLNKLLLPSRMQKILVGTIDWRIRID